MESAKLNIIPLGKLPVFNVSQNDNTRYIRLYLMENGAPYALTGEEDLTLRIEKPDKTSLSIDLTNNGGDYIDLQLTSNITNKAGACYCKIRITNGSEYIGTEIFKLNVEKAP
jgi:hypothetical protein